ncbi:MAG: hypothetical protein HKN04_00505 [Rhodothermaceae bacterium]|nr:hypothetical protein [Rhodothermaceae bacterium]
MLRRLSHLVLILTAALGLAACDSAEELSQTDAELIVGFWLATDAGVRTIVPGVTVSVFDALGAGDEIAMEFEANGQFAFAFDVDDDASITVSSIEIPLADVNLTGTYTVDDAANRLALTPAGTSAAALVEYDFNGENAFDLIVEDPELVALLFGIADADLLATVVTGAELTFSRQSSPVLTLN